MELKTFIAETLSQILEGVREAQQREGGEAINASMPVQPGGNLINAGKSKGMITRVDFDVEVSAETSGQGGANLKVFGVGAEAGAEHKRAGANRIKFSVPVRLPDGGDVETPARTVVVPDHNWT